MGNVQVHVWERTSYSRCEVYLDTFGTVNLYRGGHHEFRKGKSKKGLYMVITLFDHHGRSIKQTSFHTHPDHSWNVNNDGIRQHGGGIFHRWQTDNESYYNNVDRQNKEAAERAAKEARERAEKAAREKKEKEEREKAERELYQKEREESQQSQKTIYEEMMEKETMAELKSAHINLTWKTQTEMEIFKMNEVKARVERAPLICGDFFKNMAEDLKSDETEKRLNALEMITTLHPKLIKLDQEGFLLEGIKTMFTVHFEIENEEIWNILKKGAECELIPSKILSVIFDLSIENLSEELIENSNLKPFILFVSSILSGNNQWDEIDEDDEEELFKKGAEMLLNSRKLGDLFASSNKDMENMKIKEIDFLKKVYKEFNWYSNNEIKDVMDILGNFHMNTVSKLPEEFLNEILEIVEKKYELPFSIIEVLTECLMSEERPENFVLMERLLSKAIENKQMTNGVLKFLICIINMEISSDIFSIDEVIKILKQLLFEKFEFSSEIIQVLFGTSIKKLENNFEILSEVLKILNYSLIERNSKKIIEFKNEDLSKMCEIVFRTAPNFLTNEINVEILSLFLNILKIEPNLPNLLFEIESSKMKQPDGFLLLANFFINENFPEELKKLSFILSLEILQNISDENFKLLVENIIGNNFSNNRLTEKIFFSVLVECFKRKISLDGIIQYNIFSKIPEFLNGEVEIEDEDFHSDILTSIAYFFHTLQIEDYRELNTAIIKGLKSSFSFLQESAIYLFSVILNAENYSSESFDVFSAFFEIESENMKIISEQNEIIFKYFFTKVIDDNLFIQGMKFLHKISTNKIRFSEEIFNEVESRIETFENPSEGIKILSKIAKNNHFIAFQKIENFLVKNDMKLFQECLVLFEEIYEVEKFQLKSTTLKFLLDKTNDSTIGIPVRIQAANVFMQCLKNHPKLFIEEMLDDISLFHDPDNPQINDLRKCFIRTLFWIDCPDVESLLEEALDCDEKTWIICKSKEFNGANEPNEMNWFQNFVSQNVKDSKLFITRENSKVNKSLRENPSDKTNLKKKLRILIAKAEIAKVGNQLHNSISLFKKAEKYLQENQLESNNQLNSLLYSNLGAVCNLAGFPKMAISYLNKAIIEGEVSSHEINIEKVKSLMLIGKFDDALSILNVDGILENSINEIELCRNSSTFFKNLKEFGANKAEAKYQNKMILLNALNQKMTCVEISDFYQFLIKRSKYFDISIVGSSIPFADWKISFLRSELIGRLEPNSTEFQMRYFNIHFENFKSFHENSNIESSILFSITENIISKIPKEIPAETNDEEKENSISTNEINLQNVNELLQYLLIDAEKIEGILSNAGQDLVEQFKREWMKKLLEENVPTMNYISKGSTEDEITDFCILFDSIKIDNKIQRMEELIVKFGSKNSHGLIKSFIQFLKDNSGLENENLSSLINTILNPLRINASEDSCENENDINSLKEQLKTYFFSEKILKIWGKFERFHALESFLISMTKNDFICKEDFEQMASHFVEIPDKEFKPNAEILFETLSICHSYKLNQLGEKFKSLFSWENPPLTWKKKIHEIIVNTYFSGESKDTDIDGLIKELRVLNKNSSLKVKTIIDNLKPMLNKVDECFKEKSKLSQMENFPIISKYKIPAISKWAKLLKSNPLIAQSNNYLPEMIAILNQAVKLHVNYFPRKVNIMSLIFLVQSNENGRLAKISTGEGKSTIVSMLAAIKVLQGSTVDIVTSSPILAKRDAEEWRNFYASLHISSMDNSEEQCATGKAKSCYNQNIVYGDPSTFEGDTLRHEFNLLGTRGNRKFDVVIVDEVDSMFIDNSNHSTRLIDKMPAMEHLEPVFLIIWNFVNDWSMRIYSFDSKTHIMENKYSKNLDETIVSILPENVKREFDVSVKNIKEVLSFYSNQMKEQQKGDMKNREQIAEMLQSKIKSDKKINAGCAVVEKWIEEQWDISKSENLLAIIEMFFKIKIFIYDQNASNEIDFSSEFHTERNSYEEYNEAEVKTFRFLVHEDSIVYLKQVEDEIQYIKNEVYNSTQKMFTVASNSEVDTEISEMERYEKENKAPPVNPNETIKLPRHLKSLFDNKLDEWIDSAVRARFSLVLNRDYIIKLAKRGENIVETITPVDFINTGVIQEATVWGDALHQFLQLKHHLSIQPEFLATNFLSNMTYFRRYGKNIFGLTGTLGNKDEEDLLMSLYAPIDTVRIPTFRQKRNLELNSIVARNVEEWLQQICITTLVELENARAVLIICKTIDESENVQNFLKLNLPPDVKYRMYTRNDRLTDEEALKDELDEKSVIIATNLAGRGTNIKLSKSVVSNGGLHVCLSFLPANLRIEEQAIGRTARKGEPGTNQMIINVQSDLMDFENEDDLKMVNIRKHRDEREKKRVLMIRNKLAKELEIEEKQFEKFCKIKKDFLAGKSRKEINKTKYILEGLSERWAIRLEEAKTSNEVKNWDKLDKEFDQFFTNLILELQSDSVIRNPNYYILTGNLEMCQFENNSIAIHYYTKAMSLESVFVINAYYNRAYAIINEAKADYKDRAIKDLQKAARLIQIYAVKFLMQMHSCLENRKLEMSSGNKDQATSIQTKDSDSFFTKQIIEKLNFYFLQLNNIKETINKINDYKNAEICAEFKRLEEYYDENKQPHPQDLNEIRDSGFISFMFIKKKPVPWWTLLAIFLLGAIQVVVGACCMIFTGGTFGSGLVSAGITDFVTGIRAARTGEFSWDEYWKEKGITLAIGLLVAGLGSVIGAAAKFAYSAISKVVTGVITKIGSSSAASWLGTAFSKCANFVMNNVINPIKNGLKMCWDYIKSTDAYQWIHSKAVAFGKKCQEWATKAKDWALQMKDKAKNFLLKGMSEQTMKNLGRAIQIIGIEVGKQGMNFVVDKFVIGPICDEIEAKIKNDLKKKFTEELNNEEKGKGKQMNVLLSSCKPKEYEGKINDAVNDILSDKSHPAWAYIKSLINSLASSFSDKLKEEAKTAFASQILNKNVFAGLATRLVSEGIVGTVYASVAAGQIGRIVPDFSNHLNRRLVEFEAEHQSHLGDSEHLSCPTEGLSNEQIAELRESFAEEWATEIAAKIREGIEENLMKPASKYGVNFLCDKIGGMDALKDDLKDDQINTGKYKEFTSNLNQKTSALTSKIFKFEKSAQNDSPGSDKKSDSSNEKRQEYANKKKDNGKKYLLTGREFIDMTKEMDFDSFLGGLDSPADFTLNAEANSVILNRPFEIYYARGNQGDVYYEGTYGNRNSNSEPVRLVITKNEDYLRVNPLVRDQTGNLELHAMSTEKDSYLNSILYSMKRNFNSEKNLGEMKRTFTEHYVNRMPIFISSVTVST